MRKIEKLKQKSISKTNRFKFMKPNGNNLSFYSSEIGSIKLAKMFYLSSNNGVRYIHRLNIVRSRVGYSYEARIIGNILNTIKFHGFRSEYYKDLKEDDESYTDYIIGSPLNIISWRCNSFCCHQYQ